MHITQTITEQLIDINNRIKSETIIDNVTGDTFLPHYLEAWFFDLLYNHRDELLSPANIELTKTINDVIVYVLTHVVVNNEMSLLNGQTTYNAAVTEYNIHYTYQWSYGGKGELDHSYHHTGYGWGNPDFQLTDDTDVVFFNKEIGAPDRMSLKAGYGIDAKDYWNRDTAATALAANVDGSLGHYGHKLLLHIMSEDSYLITDNIAGAPVYRLMNFNPKKIYKQVKLDLDPEGILIVSYYEDFY